MPRRTTAQLPYGLGSYTLAKAERDYTRADDGKFSETGGGGGSKKAPPKKAPKQTPEEKAEAQRAEQAENRAAAAEATGLDASAMEALDEFASPDEVIALSDANREKLTAAGLVEQGPDGEDRLTSAGRTYLNAAEKGDARAAADAMSRGKERADKKAEAKAKADARAQAKADKEKAKADKEKADAEKKPKGGGGGGGKGGDEPDKATQQAEAKERATQEAARTAGYAPAAVAGLRAAADGGAVDEEVAGALMKAGLMEETPDGPQLTAAGRKALSALEKGDARGAVAARQDDARAARQADERTAQAKERQSARETRDKERATARVERDAKTKAREEKTKAREQAKADKERQAQGARDAAARRQDELAAPFRRAATGYGLGAYSLGAYSLSKRAGRPLAKRAVGLFHGFAPIAKADDGERLVFGIASTAIVDDQPGVWEGKRYDGDIVDPEAMREALATYWGNIRTMHEGGPQAAGRALDVLPADDGRTYLVAKVVDDDAWRKVKTRIYHGFSIGGRVLKARLERLADGRIVRRILKLLLTEISLVDRPANPEAAILVYKRHPQGGDMENETERPDASQGGGEAEQPDALAGVAKLAGDEGEELIKAAGDPMKVVAQIQALRNEAELAGDLEAAERYTQAIGLLLVASGDAEAGDIDEDIAEEEEEIGADLADVAADGAAAEADKGMQLKAAGAEVRKAGRIIAAKRMTMLKQALRTYAKALADAGDEDAIKMLKAVESDEAAPTGEAMKAALGELRKELAADVEKTAGEPLQTIARALLKVHEQVQTVVADVAAIKAQPAGGGPVTRFNGQPVAKGLGAAGGTQQQQAAGPDPAEIARLRRLATLETNPVTKQQYLDELKKLGA